MDLDVGAEDLAGRLCGELIDQREGLRADELVDVLERQRNRTVSISQSS